ncbi:MAG: hypothetical protein WD995_10200 [Gemmatimonadota bacterium]
MPPSRYVSAGRLQHMVLYLMAAVAVLVGAEVVVRLLDLPQAARRILVALWWVALPVGGWLVWRRAPH